MQCRVRARISLPQSTYYSASFRACSRGFVGEAEGFAEQALGGAKPGLSYERAQDGCDFREQSFSFPPDQEAKHADGNEAVLKGGVASSGFIHQDKVRVQFQSQREGLGFAGVEVLVPVERSGYAADWPGLERGWQDKARKPSGRRGEAQKFGVNGWRNEHLAKQLGQQLLLADEGQVEDDGGIGNDNHSPRRRSSAVRSACRSSGV